MNYVYSLLGFQGIGFTNFNWILWPALVINVVLYAILYLLFRELVVRRRARRRAGVGI